KESIDALEKKFEDSIRKLDASIKVMKEESDAKFKDLKQLILSIVSSQSKHMDLVPQITKCMTRSLTKELFTPFKDPEREFRSSRKHFKTLSLDESRSPDFDLFSDQEEYSEEEVAKTMAETMEQYMSKTRADYGSGIARPKIKDKDSFELKG
ncbi:hypothetical protein Tco_1130493, partial [Tanacetum coccineum]